MPSAQAICSGTNLTASAWGFRPPRNFPRIRAIFQGLDPCPAIRTWHGVCSFSDMRALLYVSGLLVACSGCSLEPAIHENSGAIGRSTEAIQGNTRAVEESTRSTEALLETMKGLQRLEAPMEAVARLREPLERAAALREPLERAGELRGPLSRLADLPNEVRRSPILAWMALGGLLGWGLVTYLAVRLAIRGAPPRKGAVGL